jgi:hypothetical protein
MIYGVSLVVVVPALVELAKHAGLPVRYAGLAAIGTATALVALADVAGLLTLPGSEAAGGNPYAAAAGWLVAGVVYGLAGAGFYSQARLQIESRRAEPGASAGQAP